MTASSRARAVAIAVLFTAIAVVYTRPLLWHLRTSIASDPYDPILNAAILWWNATTMPFTAAWWNPPFFHPAAGISAFTEHLAGISAFATPFYWLIRDPIAAYNLALFVTWPLSALAVWWLVRRLTDRDDAAIVAGLAYGFTPYRMAEIAHIQSLSSFWLPVALVGMHAYVEERRRRWLLVFGLAWLMQSLANGYYLLMGAVLVGLWLAYFGTARRAWSALMPLVSTWSVFSLPLVPVLLKYRDIHEHYGLRRELYEVLAFSAQPHSFAEVSGTVLWWSRVLPASEHDLFPGATCLLLVLPAAVAALWRWHIASTALPRRRRLVVRLLFGATLLSVVALGVILVRGPWRIERGDTVLFEMDNLNRALALLALAGGALATLTPRIRAALTGRNPLVFYAAATIVMAVLACGPVLRVGDATVLAPAPYTWLMTLPGFDQIRVPRRFWMLGVLALSTAAGLAFDRLTAGRAARRALFVVVAAGVLMDGWLVAMPTAAPPLLWPDSEHSDSTHAILQLPLGPDWDGAATFRAISHRRPTVNGVSGYEPSHYAPLQAGLNAHDADMLAALASLGPYDIVIDRAEDRDGGWERYAMTAPGAAVFARTEGQTVVRVPRGPSLEPTSFGPAIPIVTVHASANDAAPAIDGRINTQWEDGPQHDGQWLTADLGGVRDVAGVSTALGEYARDFPRHLAVDVSLDGDAWTTVWDRPAAALAFLAATREPRVADVRMAFPPLRARFVRLRQTATDQNLWRVAELHVHASPTPQP